MADEYDAQTGEIIDNRLPAMVEPPRREMNLIFSSPDCAEVFGALSVAQGGMENPKKTKSAKVKGRTKNGSEYEYSYAYAPLDEIMNVIRAPLAGAKLVHRQFLAQRGEMWVMRTIIAHETGQWYGCDYPIFWDESRGMQGFASGVTYARRYGLMMALGIVGEDDDDANMADGNSAKIATGRPQAQGNGPEATPAPQTQTRAQRPPQQTAEQPSAEKAEARKRYREMQAEIDGAATAREIDAIFGSLAWASMKTHVMTATPGEVGDGAIARLVARGEARKAEIGDGKLQEYEV